MPATLIHHQEQSQPHLLRIQGNRANGTLDPSPGLPSTPQFKQSSSVFIRCIYWVPTQGIAGKTFSASKGIEHRCSGSALRALQLYHP